MPHIPRWIGSAGFVLMFIFCAAFLGGYLLLFVLLLIPCFVIVAIENRYERGLMG
jgi:hypothetical protein